MQSTVETWWPWPLELQELMKDNPWPPLLVLTTIFYLTLVRILRFRAIHNLETKYATYVKNPYSLDYKTAQEIMHLSMLHDMPWMHFFGTSWALVKTYSIASGTSLLVATGQLTTSAKVGRRAEDTGVAIAEFVVGSVDSERGLRALSKVNWLHARYGAKIKNKDMIHTLAMFVLEPQRWIEKYEWRPMTELEKVAMFIYWKEIGNRMGIQGIPETLDELKEYVNVFEKENMFYSDDNRICAETTMDLYLRNVPGFMQAFARNAANSLLEPRVRVALGSPAPPQYVQHLVSLTLRVRGWVVGHLFLPRLRCVDVLGKPGPEERLQRRKYAFEPWYVKDSVWAKASAWILSGGSVVLGTKWQSTGYLPEEIGPAEYVTASRKPVLKQAEEMKKYAESGGAAAMGCPFAFVAK